jgi:uncharacterized heparinase superfamily protein
MEETTLARLALTARLEAVRNRLLDHLSARFAGRSRKVTAFVSQPEPRTIGSFSRGRQLIAGNFLFAGYLVEAPGASIWNLARPSEAFEAELHGFGWLDDLAAVGDAEARDLARAWLVEWIESYGRGTGPGWTPALAGRRVIRWINHALFLLRGQDKEQSDRFFRNLARQTTFLGRRWKGAPAGLQRFEALTGLIHAGLSLEGAGHLVEPAVKAMADECAARIDPEGGIPTRNPEELMEVFTLLNWASSALSDAGHMPQRQHLLAIERIAPTLRALRHADGGLARFHGGGRGIEGRLDQALAASGIRATASTGLAMGYARLSAGRTSIVIDASPPPAPEYSKDAHASTLGFEMTSGRRPVIVNCGSGAEFGREWNRAARATPSHSTLAIEGYSSSRFAPHSTAGSMIEDLLVDAPTDVRVQQSSGLDGSTVLATHNGYSPTHGLIHVRRLDLSLDGRSLSGEDTIGALSESDRIAFEELMNRTRLKGVRFDIRFHLHPDITPEIDMGGTAVSMSLKSGEVWVFRHDSEAELSVEASVYLEKGRLKPRATKQIVLSDTVLDYSAHVAWTLSRAQDGTRHVRDLDPDDRLPQT